MAHSIYKITNLVNGKIYIGQTNNFDRRWKEHSRNAKTKPRQLVENAMLKYGIDNFSYELIDECSTQEEANAKEIQFIAANNSISPNGYNIETGGKYAPQSEASLAKISQSLKGRPSRNKGVPCSEAQKAKTSATMKGRKYSEERVRNSSRARIGLVPWNKGKGKLTIDQVIAIRADNRFHRVIAKEYGVSVSLICVVKNEVGAYMSKVEIIDQKSFDDIIKQSIVIVKFMSNWCKPCALMDPVLEKVAVAANGKYKVVKLNVDDCPEIAGRYKVRAIPTLIVFKNGAVHKTHSGTMSFQEVLELLE